MKYIETPRLILRQWKESDRSVFAELNADPKNLVHFPATLTREKSDTLMNRSIALIARDGYGLFAVELIETGEFIGFVGLNRPKYETPFTPCVEIAWRLHKKFWKNGYATEAAKAVADFGFNKLGLDEIVSFTSHLNTDSIKVMEKIGMVRDLNGDFDHPNLQEGHPLRRHVLYRLTR